MAIADLYENEVEAPVADTWVKIVDLGPNKQALVYGRIMHAAGEDVGDIELCLSDGDNPPADDAWQLQAVSGVASGVAVPIGTGRPIPVLAGRTLWMKSSVAPTHSQMFASAIEVVGGA